jgi:hypothetical protein
MRLNGMSQNTSETLGGIAFIAFALAFLVFLYLWG